MDVISDPFQSLPFSIHFTPWMVWIPFGLFIGMYLILSGVLYYHWITYGMKARGILIAEFLFPLGTAFLFYIACIGLSFLF